MPRRLFITLEGGEGAGKSTNLDFIHQWLQHEGCDVVVTREPGGTELGEHIRDFLLHSKQLHIAPESEVLLMFAARTEHISKVIRPSLEAGKVVLCDRFTDATYAYQGGGRGLDADRIAAIENWVQGDLRPDLTLLFDVSVEAGRERAGQRSEPDRFERENNEFFRRVRETYIARATREPKRIRIIDASRPIEQVEQQIVSVLQEAVHGR
ncbi:MAG: dTMP kinase [Gammaproteobacteria bacterium]|nr:dTMP kinase [Gammaproteobacteria bacterium]MDH3370288.1 dTMP kinase [Gammaproteobacteria bacterium]MDH3406569.1 dTMP kinase [Gammaproteobacteria bacterium]MDH3562427.1 dTMP kinase [Gammaproteobacteria bacterium]MDH5486280.1 dTMP kinase [Gammaproteobacteria bacterium]